MEIKLLNQLKVFMVEIQVNRIPVELLKHNSEWTSCGFTSVVIDGKTSLKVKMLQVEFGTTKN